jgi:hypothetical protein
MQTDPMEFFRVDLPALFAKGVAGLEAKGSEGAAARLADVKGARGAVRVVLEGEGGGELFLSSVDGVMSAHDTAPEGLPIRMAVGAPYDALKMALEEAETLELLQDEEGAAYRSTRLVSKQTDDTLEGHVLEFHVSFVDLPTEPDAVTLRVGMGTSEPPADPTFAVEVSWDDVEDVREGDLTPQQLFGRLKITGDASKAMALGMTLMQQRRG